MKAHSMKKLLKEEQPQIVYLVNAAGAGRMGKVENIDEKDHAFVLDINVRALTMMSRVCLPYMHKGSKIIQLCSGSAFLPQPEFASYAASKSYVLSFSRALGQEVKKKGITVTCVCPGPVNTEFFDRAEKGADTLFIKKWVMAKPQEVVKKALMDARNKKEVSVYGLTMKAFYATSKTLPHKFMLKVMRLMK